MNKITDKAGLPRFTFHALRHSFATRMLEANVPAKVVQDVLGHSDVTLTLNTYSHVMGSTAHDQMSKINNLFKSNDILNQQNNMSLKDKINEGKNKAKISFKRKPNKSKIKSIHEK